MNQKFKTLQQNKALAAWVDALVMYINQSSNESLKTSIAGLIAKERPQEDQLALFEPNPKDSLITIHDDVHAWKHALWVVSRTFDPLYGDQQSANKLVAWTKHYQEPENIILGFFLGIIIGPTLGNISSKKKKGKGSVVINKNWFDQATEQEKMSQIGAVVTKLIAKELHSVHGNAALLDPDTKEWLESEQSIDLYIEESKERLQETVITASNQSLDMHVAGSIDTAIALSPALDIDKTPLKGELLT